MSKVTAETMTPAHVKAARALLGLSAEDLAELLPIGLATLRTFESGKQIKTVSRLAIFETLRDHGVHMQNGGSPGVRITEPNKWTINTTPAFCPKCEARMPVFRKPANLRQMFWGGWTCQTCGTEVSKMGHKLFERQEEG